MSKRPMGTGFRFSKLMAWAPTFLIVMGAMSIVGDDTLAGLLIAMSGVVFAILVKRRARRAEDERHRVGD